MSVYNCVMFLFYLLLKYSFILFFFSNFTIIKREIYKSRLVGLPLKYLHQKSRDYIYSMFNQIYGKTWDHA
jgi:hypothetical protein